MKITYHRANLLDASQQIIIHGCNAQGAMNSGVAKAIRARYPQAFSDYSDHHAHYGLRMGEVIWSPNEPHIVGNAITQKFYGRDPGTRYVSYDAIADVMEQCNRIAKEAAVEEIAMPFIGAGLANGKWRVIEQIIQEYSQFQPVIYYLPELLPDDLPADLRERLA